MINKIYYINLENRKDRKESVIEELKKLNYPSTMIERIDAVKKDNGAYGCTLSHLKALENAIENDYDCVMIVEDDLGFKENINSESFDKLTNHLMKECPNFDICSLTTSTLGNHIKMLKVTDYVSKAIVIGTTTGYIVRKKFFKILYENFKKSEKNFENNQPAQYSAIDVLWVELQGKDKEFYIFKPTIAVQKPSYSDIEKKFTNYF